MIVRTKAIPVTFSEGGRNLNAIVRNHRPGNTPAQFGLNVNNTYSRWDVYVSSSADGLYALLLRGNRAILIRVIPDQGFNILEQLLVLDLASLGGLTQSTSFVVSKLRERLRTEHGVDI